MRKRVAFLAIELLALLLLTPARASGDLGCSLEWKLVNPAMTGCDNLVALGPGNDTRVNLLLLLMDRYGTPPHQTPAVTRPMVVGWRDFRDLFIPVPVHQKTDYADGEGSRCRSNESGEVAFDAALTAASLVPRDERAALLNARQTLAPKCTEKGGVGTAVDASIQGIRSAPGQSFATYLQAAAAFYDGRFDEAASAFTGLKSSAQAWVAEAAAYMVARVAVNRLQAGAFDQFGSFKGSDDVDQQVADRAEESLGFYLRDHPHGVYANSARGLLRRVDWLAGRTEKLAMQYAALLAKPPADRDVDDAALVEEIDSKLLPRLTPPMTRDPILLAVMDLLRMRDPKGAIRLDELEMQRPAFAAASPLFAYLLAVRAFYVDQDPHLVLPLLPDATGRRDGDHLWFSRQLVRGFALEALGDRNARGFWTELFPGATRPLEGLTVQLALAMHDERHGALPKLFANGSPVDSPAIREILLDRIADGPLLRRQAHDQSVPQYEREVALYTLLFKEVTRGRYTDFLADAADVPSDPVPPDNPGNRHRPLQIFTQTEKLGDFNCPPLATTAAQLARNPRAIRGQICLAEFVRVNDLDEDQFDVTPSADQLGGTPSLFPGKPYARAETYRTIIADRDAPAGDRAFALFRAIRCYAPTGRNQCGGSDVPVSQRKAWFYSLKRDYPASPWAGELTVWW